MDAAGTVPSATTQTGERRTGDRRRRPTPLLSRYTLFGGRRLGDRRGGGAAGSYVDRYSPGLAVSLVAVGVLCALDAVFTLLYLQKNGTEANPIMDALIHATGARTFVVVKCLVTNVGLVVLCAHKNFPLVRAVIGGLLAVYSALFVYHIYLATTVR